MWSVSRQILDAIPRHDKVAIPSCFSSSKSWALARAALWFTNVHPVGTARVITIAPQWRQVSGIMWGTEIRGAHARAGLPGQVGDITYKVKNTEGQWLRVAEGIVGNPRNEAATQGLHSANLLLLVDEAGGIPHGVGRNLRGLLTSEGTRMVAIGNPPADNEGSWFEDLCQRRDVLVIPIPATATPNFTLEPVKRCRTCPPEAPEHTIAKHLIRRSFEREVRTEFGEDSPYYQAKILARFPKGGSLRIIPSQWVEDCVDVDEPDGAQYVRLDELGLPDERDGWRVKRGAWIRLGIDVAADGGDEFVVARSVGDLGTIEHTSSGMANANALDVAGVCLEQIKRAQRLAHAIGTTARVRVKVDVIGVGWGVVSVLKAWGSEGLHDADIIAVNVAEATGREDVPESAMRPALKRDEMWISGRYNVQPQPDTGVGMVRLRIDRRTVAQLSTPSYGTTSGGKTKVEAKVSVRKRIPNSPDRAEALLLAFYEPQIEDAAGPPRLLV